MNLKELKNQEAKSKQVSDPQQYKIKTKAVLDPDMIYSKAFQALSASALKTLIRCLQKRTWKKERRPGTSLKRIVYTNVPFIFPYAEATFLKIGTTQHWKNMRLLIARGFIELVHQGGRYQCADEKDYSVYRLSEHWRQYGLEGFIPTEKEKVLNPDFYIRNNIERQKIKSTSLS